MDANVQLSGGYLSRETSNMSVARVFDRIEYLDEANRWVVLNRSMDGHGLSLFTDHSLAKIEEFFYLRKKCFLVRLAILYRLHQFLYRHSMEVLRLKFSDGFIRKKENLTFFTKKSGTMQTSKIVNYYSAHDHLMHFSEELFELEVQDKLQLLKNPWSLFYAEHHVNDVNLYIKKVIKNFKETYRLATINLPLKESNYQLQLDDEMFVQYYRQVQQVEDESQPKNYNFKRQFYIIHFGNSYKLPDTYIKPFDLTFSLIFDKKKILLTSSQSYPGLILSLLNLLSIYLNLSVLDLQNYFGRIRPLFSFTYKQLVRLRMVLRDALAGCLRESDSDCDAVGNAVGNMVGNTVSVDLEPN